MRYARVGAARIPDKRGRSFWRPRRPHRRRRGLTDDHEHAKAHERCPADPSATVIALAGVFACRAGVMVMVVVVVVLVLVLVSVAAAAPTMVAVADWLPRCGELGCHRPGAAGDPVVL